MALIKNNRHFSNSKFKVSLKKKKNKTFQILYSINLQNTIYFNYKTKMLTVPKLSHHPLHKRQNTLENLYLTNLSPQPKIRQNITRTDRNIQLQATLDMHIKNKENFPHRKKNLEINTLSLTESQQHSKLNVQSNSGFTQIQFLPQKTKIQLKKQPCEAFYPKIKTKVYCFSPKYIKEREYNQKILQSLKLQNQKYKELILQSENITKRQNITLTSEFSFLNQSQKYPLFKPKMKKTPQKQVFYHPRQALEEMTNLTTSFILDDSSAASPFEEIKVQRCNNLPSELCLLDFQKIKFLGKGNFGQVNLVRHKRSKFVCAMKTIKKSFVKQENMVQQLSRQIRIHLSLKHLNIISFYGFFDDHQNVYLLMEYATGGELYKKLKESYRMSQKEVAPIIKNTLDGLKMIHSLGYIHRDIKPENVIFQFGIGKICDLGWAADCGFNEMRKSYCGTPLYLPPEMIRKQNYDQSADIWSIGILTYELLVGKIPFNIWSEYDLQQIVDRDIKFPTSYVDMSENSMDFIRKCLTKNPALRVKLQHLNNHPFMNENLNEGYFNVDVYNAVEHLFE